MKMQYISKQELEESNLPNPIGLLLLEVSSPSSSGHKLKGELFLILVPPRLALFPPPTFLEIVHSCCKHCSLDRVPRLSLLTQCPFR